MDVLLINVNDDFSLGLMSIQAVLKKNGVSCRILMGESEGAVMGAIEREKPLIIGITCTSMDYYAAIGTARKIKETVRTPIIFGGIHPTIFPQMIEDPSVDYVCRGEGEYPLLELVESIKSGCPTTAIPNIWAKEKGQITKNPPRPLIHDLDELPFPDWGDYYQKHPLRGMFGVKNFMAGRGCSHNCSFCFNHQYRGIFVENTEYFRQHSVDYIIREVKGMRDRYGVYACHFMDDTFGTDGEWLAEFAEKFGEELGIPFTAAFSADEVDERAIVALRKAGLRMVRMGLESSNERIRRGLLNKGFTNAEYLEKARMMRDKGIKVWTYILHGVITQTDDDTVGDMLMVHRSKPFIADNIILLYYPGLRITEVAEGKKLLVEPPGRRKFPGQKVCPIPYRSFNLYLLFRLGCVWPGLIPPIRLLAKLPFTRGVTDQYAFLEKATQPMRLPRVLWCSASLSWKGFAIFLLKAAGYHLLPGRGGTQNK
jgi:anaerobic magnesium-protoporphyrin IX monomethyl ester cyclase